MAGRILIAILLLVPTVLFAQMTVSSEFPVAPEIFADEPFNGCEGLGFNGEGRLFATCNRALWEIGSGGEVRHIVDLHSNLGVAAYGGRDMLVADFGPTNAFQNDRNNDGMVWLISPEGDKVEHSSGYGDPNFVLVFPDRSYLVSDDATADIYFVGSDRRPMLYSTAVNHPNGLALSADGSMLYVAQIFASIRPVVADNAIWRIPLVDGKPSRGADLAVRTGPNGAVDGLAMDAEDRVYIASNGEGKIWRYDPKNNEMQLIAEGMFGAASIAFGVGDFGEQAIYVSTTRSKGRGGKIFRVEVGASAGPLYR